MENDLNHLSRDITHFVTHIKITLRLPWKLWLIMRALLNIYIYIFNLTYFFLTLYLQWRRRPPASLRGTVAVGGATRWAPKDEVQQLQCWLGDSEALEVKNICWIGLDNVERAAHGHIPRPEQPQAAPPDPCADGGVPHSRQLTSGRMSLVIRLHSLICARWRPPSKEKGSRVMLRLCYLQFVMDLCKGEDINQLVL